MHRLAIAFAMIAASPVLAQTHRDEPHRIPQRVQPAVAKRDTLFHGRNAHCYFDQKTLTWKIGNDVIERRIHFESDPGALRTESVKTMEGAPAIAMVAPNEGELTVTAGGATKTLRLDRDWAYIWQSVATPPHGGRLLTVHLQGIRSNYGYEVEALYEVLPGNRPYLSKSLTLINHTPNPVTLTGATYDRWILAEGPARTGKGSPSPSGTSTSIGAARQIVSHPGGHGGIEVFVAGPDGKVASTGGELAPQYSGSVQVPPGGRAWTPRSVVFAYHGARDMADTLYNRFDAAPKTASK